MNRVFEIHRMRVETAQDATSVVGEVTGMTFGGTGYVSGCIDTLHLSKLFAHGRGYSSAADYNKATDSPWR
jgi:hypothetical protein